MLRQLEARLRELLPAELANRVKPGQVKGKCLILYTDSPAWAARLRFLAPQLVKQIGDACTMKPATIQVKVLPTSPPPSSSPRRRSPGLSDGTRRLIEQVAGGISDEKLAAALRRLARGKTGRL